MKSILLILYILVVCFSATAQQENALPPGPARISGTIWLKDSVLPNATIRVLYLLEQKEFEMDFRSNANGRYDVFFNNGAKQIRMCVIADDKICFVKQIKQVHEGTNEHLDLHLSHLKRVRKKEWKIKK